MTDRATDRDEVLRLLHAALAILDELAEGIAAARLSHVIEELDRQPDDAPSGDPVDAASRHGSGPIPSVDREGRVAPARNRP